MRMHASWFGSLRPTEYKVAARVPRAPTASSPRTPSSRPPPTCRRAQGCQGTAWKRRSWGGRSTRRPALTASCARRPPRCVGRGEETGFQIEQRNRSRKQEREIAALKPLDNEEPIQGVAWQVRCTPQGWATANLDSLLRAPALQYCGSGRRNGIPGRTKKPIKKDAPLRNRLTKKPIQGGPGLIRMATMRARKSRARSATFS
jgi:hypothetical protein